MKLKPLCLTSLILFYPLFSFAETDCQDLNNSIAAAKEQAGSNSTQLNPELLITKIGNPDKKTASGYIYRWLKDGYTLEIIKDDAGFSSAGLMAPPSSASNKANPPDELKMAYAEKTIDAKIAKANQLLDEKNLQKLSLTTYVWNCISRNTLKINNEYVPMTLSIKMVFDQNNNLIFYSGMKN